MAEIKTERPPIFASVKVTGILGAIGGICGAAVGAALTYLGNVISGYPIPPDLGIYAWNAGIMGLIGATLGPPVAWTMLREVPLWRVLAEPAAVGLGASVVSMLVAPSLFAGIVPLAIGASVLRLRHEYKKKGERELGVGDNRDALPLGGP